MTRLKIAFIGIFVFLSAMWLLSLSAEAVAGFWPTRNTLVYYTGVLAIGFMSVAVILAARPVQIEGALGGLDKFYRLHKWLGIAATLLGVVHWLLELIPRWMVRQGWLERPPRGGGGGSQGAMGFDLFRNLRGIAADLGEWSLYLLLVLVTLALWKRFPYKYFFKTHRLMAAVYLVLVFHAVILIDRSYWAAPIGPVVALLLAGGSVAAVTALFRRIGQSRRAVGNVETLKTYADNAGLEVGIRLETAWPGHRAGQFAFVTFDDSEGAHPFTISSGWRRDGRVTFTIKGIGDYTRKLPALLRTGQAVTVEGPYGCFDFQGDCDRQIWVAGGVGITPFIAQLQALGDQGQDAPVDLVYTTSSPDDAFINNIRRLASKVGARLHLWLSQRDGRLTADKLCDLVPQWEAADVWFCGPLGLGNALRDDLMARGLPARHFHQELFDMR